MKIVGLCMNVNNVESERFGDGDVKTKDGVKQADMEGGLAL